MKLITLTAALAALSTAAFAQTVSRFDNPAYPVNQIRTLAVTQTSASGLTGGDVRPYENLNVYCVGTAASTSASLLLYTADGTQVGSRTFNCSTTGAEVVSFTAGTFGFVNTVVSPSAGLSGVNSVRTVFVRTPSPYTYRQ